MTRKKSSSRRKSSGRSAAPGKPPARGGGSRRRSRRGRGSVHAHQPRDTSLPTSRTAYVATRRWLLERHGS
ncbi:MAG: hypothetical protein KGL38_05400, partial [Gemmatimonadota bacterium]|nr:hypothetical protein [Gemmatimonadota bacterium]